MSPSLRIETIVWDSVKRDATDLINLQSWLRTDVDITKEKHLTSNAKLCPYYTKEKKGLRTIHNSFEKKANCECISVWHGYITVLNANPVMQKFY